MFCKNMDILNLAVLIVIHSKNYKKDPPKWKKNVEQKNK